MSQPLALILFTLSLAALSACTEPRVKPYQRLLDPEVGRANKARVTALLGNPVKCEITAGQESCEYRTTAGRNDPTPSVHRPSPGFGPDLSPFEHFDVIKAHYNDVGILREWEPMVLGAEKP